MLCVIPISIVTLFFLVVSANKKLIVGHRFEQSYWKLFDHSENLNKYRHYAVKYLLLSSSNKFQREKTQRRSDTDLNTTYIQDPEPSHVLENASLKLKMSIQTKSEPLTDDKPVAKARNSNSDNSESTDDDKSYDDGSEDDIDLTDMRWEKVLKQKASNHCTKSCKEATKAVCKENYCKRGMSKSLKINCRIKCREYFTGNSLAGVTANPISNQIGSTEITNK